MSRRWPRIAVATLCSLLAFVTSASVAEAALTISQAVMLLSNPDDDLNASFYINGVMDGLLQTGAYQCPKNIPTYAEFARLTKQTARQVVMEGHGDNDLARLIAMGLEQYGCVPGKIQKMEPRGPKGK
jgi:hypothetical protein